ncbi:MAG: flagellar hook assembly protein FlgD [Burkholderiales bacterium]
MVTSTSAIYSPLPGVSGQTIPASTAAQGTTDAATASADRFLKLLVAQMKNQDPLNPMDNAQVTSQMAQINTVNGIEKVNTTLQGLSGQFMQLQVMQGAALVGQDVVVPGNRLAVQSGTGRGGFELQAPASQVRVEISSADGALLETLNLGPRPAGLHNFEWDTKALAEGVDPAGLRFKVISSAGGISKEAQALMRDRVNSVNADGKNLTLQLERSGSVPYASVKAFG